MKKTYTGRFQQKKTGRKQNRTVSVLILVVVLLVSLVTGLGFYGWQTQRAEKEFARLTAMTQTAPTEQTTATEETVTIATSVTEETIPEETVPEETQRDILPQYQTLYEENPDIWGWVSIEGTVIDYPVMHTPEEPEKYLHLDFSGNYNYAGIPFLDWECDENSDNLLIYAHNMKNGTMFRSLLQYETKTYWEKHPTFTLNSLYEEREYEVIAAFYDRVYYKTEDCFKFYQVKTVDGQEEFDQVVATLKEKALYDTGVTAEYGDQLAMLVTCAYHTKNGRFVVVGRYHEP